jgi:hypothetical protein
MGEKLGGDTVSLLCWPFSADALVDPDRSITSASFEDSPVAASGPGEASDRIDSLLGVPLLYLDMTSTLFRSRSPLVSPARNVNIFRAQKYPRDRRLT